MERRSFLQGAVLGAGLAGAGSAGAAVNAPALPGNRPQDPADLPFVTDPGERRGEMLYRSFGKTSEKISAIGMGGFHLGKSAVTDAEATRLIHEGVDRGITFMDNCWDYNDGRSELRMGAALAQGGYRDKVFLMSKMDGRTKEEAIKQIDQSLLRLRTDRIDLVHGQHVLTGPPAIGAARARFRPIVMTSFAFILGVVPLVLATGAGASARKSRGSPSSRPCQSSGMAITCESRSPNHSTGTATTNPAMGPAMPMSNKQRLESTAERIRMKAPMVPIRVGAGMKYGRETSTW